MAKQEYEDHRARAAKRAKDFSSGKTFKMVPGPNSFRILNTPAGKKSPSAFYEFQVHENVGQGKAYLRCGLDPVTGKGECFACQKHIPRLRKRGKEERAAALEPKRKLVVNNLKVNSDSGKFEGKPKLWYPSKKTGETVVAQIIGSRKRDYLSHTKGYNLSMTRTGTGQNDTRYGIIEADDEPTKIPEKYLIGLVPFDQNPDIPKYDEKKMKQALGLESSDDEDEDDEPKKKRRGRDDDDEDEDDDSDEDEDSDDDEDEEDDEPKSKKKKKSKKSRSKDDDEDEDDDDEDEEDSDDDDDDNEDGDGDSESEDDEDDDDDDGDDDEEDEDESPKKKSKLKSKLKKKKARR